jgi:hypothetical protein
MMVTLAGRAYIGQLVADELARCAKNLAENGRQKGDEDGADSIPGDDVCCRDYGRATA